MKKSVLVLTSLALTSLVLGACGNISNQSGPNPSDTSSEEKVSLPNEFSKDLLDRLRKSCSFLGNYEVNGWAYEFNTSFHNDFYYHDEKRWEVEIPEVIQYVQPQLNITFEENDQMVAHFTKYDNTDKKIIASGNKKDAENPFNLLGIKDFKLNDTQDAYLVTDLVAANEFIARVSGWNHKAVLEMSLFNFTEEEFDVKVLADTAYDGQILYNMHCYNIDKATRPDVIYPRKAEHKELEAAFEGFDASTYTINATDTAYTKEEQPEVKYTIYKTEDVVYNANDGFGYIDREDGVFDFSVREDNKAYLRTYIPRAISPVDVAPIFDCAPELFEKGENGTWKLINSWLVPEVIPSLALEYNTYNIIGRYGSDLTLNTKDNIFSGYESNYKVENLSSKLKLDVTDNGKTVLPDNVDFSNIKNFKTPASENIANEWAGTYKGTCTVGTFGGKKDIILVITNEKITINGEVATIIETDENGALRLIAAGLNFTLLNTSIDGVNFILEREDQKMVCPNFVKDESIPVEGIVPNGMLGDYTAKLSKGTIDGLTEVELSLKPYDIYINNTLVDNLTCEIVGQKTILSFTFKGEKFTLTSEPSISSLGYVLSNEDKTIYSDDINPKKPDLPPEESLVPASWVGIYDGKISAPIDGKTTITIELRLDKVLVNGMETTHLDHYKDKYEEYITFDYNGVNYTIFDLDTDPNNFKLGFFSSDYSLSGSGFIKR